MSLVLFDLDNTLVDRQSAFKDAVASLCRTHRFGSDIEGWLLAELAERANAADFARLRETFVLDESAAQLWQAYVDRMADAVTCRPAVLDGLARLRAADWTIGIVTNGNTNIQRAKLTSTGINELVDGIAVSGDIEVGKPDVRIFELAAARCGAELSGGWIIGDNPSSDIGGGHQVGLRTIWLRGRPWPGGVRAPHQVVSDVTEAIAFLLNEE